MSVDTKHSSPHYSGFKARNVNDEELMKWYFVECMKLISLITYFDMFDWLSWREEIRSLDAAMNVVAIIFQTNSLRYMATFMFLSACEQQ